MIVVRAPTKLVDEPHLAVWQWLVTVPSTYSHPSGSAFNWHLETYEGYISQAPGEPQTFKLLLKVDGQQRDEGYLLRYEMKHTSAGGGGFGNAGSCELATPGHGLKTLVVVSQAEQQIRQGDAAILGTIDGNTLMLHTTANTPRSLESGIRSPWYERFIERAQETAVERVLWRD